VDVGARERIVDPDDPVVVETALLHPAVLKANLAIFSEAQPHYRGAFDLRVNSLRIDVSAAIDRGIDPRHRELAFVVNRHLDDGRDVADEITMHGDADVVAPRHGPTHASPPCLG
jgi:hypothetical protein